jgi:hypothetical protein
MKISPPEGIITQVDSSSLQTQIEQPKIARRPQISSRSPDIIVLPPVLVDLITTYDDDDKG